MPIREELLREIEQAPDELLQVLLSFLRQTQLSSSLDPAESGNAKLNEKGHYPLRGMPSIVSEDFDESMSDLWNELGA
ncbi:hypothetical protein [Oscillatoria sp. FACHB-1406]|uniref:hypothetical protein n=1 Tax=Oscillatoria sp. FACHB-1406 TaxID=2692846 RepID=UPI001681D2AA|nr:hypothetical protein [Oscillatoria sp. FACHB-1406]MBD2579292.1 hypothetical protein [Oscillatoria sp. FACHB-1406]